MGETRRIEEIEAEGLLLIPDPHVASTPPGQRLPGYTEQILDKLAFCMQEAAGRRLVPTVLGDLFHWPRDNSNALLVALIGLFTPHRPFCLIGNHDKYQARLTDDCSVAVLAAAGAVRLIDRAGPAFRIRGSSGAALVCGSPDGTPLPRLHERSKPAGKDGEEVVWLSHHGISFPDFKDRQIALREIPGVDWVLNGHIHRPQPMIRVGETRWCNPGNVTRLTFTRRSKERVPAAAVWRPGAEELELLPVPYLPFGQVFPDQELPPEPAPGETLKEPGSGFLKGIERLAWRRTSEGAGLKDFLQANLNPELPEARLVWELYKEVVDHDA
ncbi:metallophosphoesterase [Desulfovibrio sp. X2]|uniref:metallophosphoesterase n=1 Tax=Desulfovibrio sp. X2 TaxID=941449 RepID=UPI000558616E|nr:metallophosphoesterase [Desulfovibrio sp. X2]